MNVKSIIKSKGYTLEQVAAEMVGKDGKSITKGALSKCLADNGNPTIGTLKRIADVIGCKVGDFFADEVTDTPVTSSPGGGIVWGERFIPCSTIEELRAAVEQLHGSDKGYK